MNDAMAVAVVNTAKELESDFLHKSWFEDFLSVFVHKFFKIQVDKLKGKEETIVPMFNI